MLGGAGCGRHERGVWGFLGGRQEEEGGASERLRAGQRARVGAAARLGVAGACVWASLLARPPITLAGADARARRPRPAWEIWQDVDRGRSRRRVAHPEKRGGRGGRARATDRPSSFSCVCRTRGAGGEGKHGHGRPPVGAPARVAPKAIGSRDTVRCPSVPLGSSRTHVGLNRDGARGRIGALDGARGRGSSKAPPRAALVESGGRRLHGTARDIKAQGEILHAGVDWERRGGRGERRARFSLAFVPTPPFLQS